MNFMEGRPGFYVDAEDNGAAAPEEREHMFDKVVTPSDVGKLNRLVIPKQYAEKYFPLDSSPSAEKGLLLNFEDRNGKSWRFRYSYWNSSQSYVMTKGWSRFVKEKKLDAGDIVSFHRGSGDRLFIDWRRRSDHLLPPPPLYHSSFHHSRPSATFFRSQPPPHYFHYPYDSSIVTGSPCPPGSIMYLRPPPPPGVWPHSGSSRGHVNPQQMVFESVPVVQGKVAAAKRLRLFGVNMDCPVSADDSDDINIVEFSSNHSNSVYDCDILLSSSAFQLPSPFIPSSSSSSSLARFRPDYDRDKGKGSRSLDLDI